MKSNLEISDRLANHFVTYLFEKYGGTLHVRRVASWIGFIILAAARASDTGIDLRRTRQLQFSYKKREFRVAYNHTAGPRGGIEIGRFCKAKESRLGMWWFK
jgi:hypothetical protein